MLRLGRASQSKHAAQARAEQTQQRQAALWAEPVRTAETILRQGPDFSVRFMCEIEGEIYV